MALIIIHKAKILNFLKDITDEISFVETGNTFVSSHENRLNQFGKFISDDKF